MTEKVYDTIGLLRSYVAASEATGNGNSIQCGMTRDAIREIERLQAIVRVNGLRWGHTHAEIDAIIKEKETP